MDFPVAGFLGAIAGVVIGVINYVLVIRIVEGRLRALDRSQNAEERKEFEDKLSLMRRLVLGIDIVVFTAAGYWAGRAIGG